jgi:glycosyltransferase involved in cell wall biosynthesis
MRVLHLFSNAKWTGPAEPALNLCVALRGQGVDADFACAPDAGASINKVVETARDRGIEPILQFHLSKHRRPIKNFLDRRTLAALLIKRDYDLVHCHLDNDHEIALRPAERRAMPLVRSSYEGTGLAKTSWHARLLAGTAGLIEPSQQAEEHDAQVFGFPRERMRVIPNAVDVERFDPARDVPDARRWLNIPHDAFVVGIVARLQPHRHYDDLLRALKLLVEVCPRTHAIVVGRGTRQDTVGKGPVKTVGLESVVHFAGYVEGENYVGTLKAFDAKVFLVPGTDGTCRAVREAMAMAKPVVAADRGMLREIIDDGVDGIVCDGSPEGLFRALRALASDRQYARTLGRAARAKALEIYSLDAQARAVRDFYGRLLETK